MGMGQPDRSRRRIAAGRSRIDTVDGRSERRDDRNRRDNCEDFQSDMGTSSAAPVEIVVHGQHLPRPESTQARHAGSIRVSPPTSDLIPPSPRGHKDRSGGLHVTEFSERRASAAKRRGRGRFLDSRVHCHLDKKASDAQLLNLSSREAAAGERGALSVAECVGRSKTSEGLSDDATG
jgi:hypothetical protein